MKSARKHLYRSVLAFLCALCLSASALANDLLRDDHPSRYTVVKGDTLWDISELFLKSPWLWPEIWYVNPQIANPHLIYPGDELELVYVNGRPQLRLNRGDRRVKLSPGIRSMPWDGAIPTIPIDAIAPFLSRPYVLDDGEGEAAPYLVQFADEHILGGAGQRGFARHTNAESGANFHVVRPGDAYKDGDTGEVLGYEALYVGAVEVTRPGENDEPDTVFFTNSQREAVIGDRLLELDEERPWTNFTPNRPADEVDGSIISVLDGVSQIGQYNVVVIDRGASNGLIPGHVLRIEQRGKIIRDVVTPDSRDTLKLPNEFAGRLMVFRTFDRVSFALVMDAVRPIHLLDRVRNP